jgi:hypothetical protein
MGVSFGVPRLRCIRLKRGLGCWFVWAGLGTGSGDGGCCGEECSSGRRVGDDVIGYLRYVGSGLHTPTVHDNRAVIGLTFTFLKHPRVTVLSPESSIGAVAFVRHDTTCVQIVCR